MKEITIPLLLVLILSPILRNGLGLVHHLVKHTHAFCTEGKDHQHSTEDCGTTCSFEQARNNQYPTNRTEYQELKQYFSDFFFYRFSQSLSSSPKLLFNPSQLGRCFHQEIFHPPNS